MAKKKPAKSQKKKPPEAAEPEQKDMNKPFDFGGLPARDLKKNLGCG